MKPYQIVSNVCVYSYAELSQEEKDLVNVAREMTWKSYAPYSHFYVGAALKLLNGVVVPGCNLENASFSATMCAERTAICAAGAQYPRIPMKMMAVVARNDNGFLDHPVAPCGACRQVLLEAENLYKQPIRILLVGRTEIHVMDGVSNLLPIHFIQESMGYEVKGDSPMVF